MAYAPGVQGDPLMPPAGPVVSVVTPFFNTGPVFHETAVSLLGFDAREDGRAGRRASGQSLQNFEWIIVNDGSTDPGALEVLEQYRRLAARDARVRIIDHGVNHGLPATRNTGIRAARAPYVFFLDSDDLIEPTTLEKCALHLECNPEFAFVKGYTVGFGAQEYLWTHGFHSREQFLEQNCVTATAMVRTSVLHAVGGFDESIRRGMEDWEFWLRCAYMGHWGATIEEYLDWYRRRDNQHAAWENIAHAEHRAQFLHRLKSAHPELWQGRFPDPRPAWHMSFTIPAPELEGLDERDEALGRNRIVNPLAKDRPRLLMIVPWLRLGGADRFNLDLARFLTRRAGWEVTIATTLSGHPWLAEFTAITPDVFALNHLGRPMHLGRLLSHLVRSRRPDVVMVSNSQHGYYLVPYLRSLHPEPVYVDFNHMEEPDWQNGGHPRTGVGMQEQLDLSIVVSEHLKRWMCGEPRRADPKRIEVCHINADTGLFKPDAEARAAWREELEIAEDAPVLLYAARLCAQKQPLVLARTMEMLASRRSDFVTLVAGEGELGDALRGAIDRAGIGDRVRMIGSVNADRMPGLMAACDVFFLPSQWEGIALSFYEAMATGLVVVGADVGGQSELVTPETGILLKFVKRDPEVEAQRYADALDGLLGDPARMRSLGRAARERIERHFELETMGRRMLECFRLAGRWQRDWPRARVPAGLGRELATLGTEVVRVHELADELWQYRQRYFDLTGERKSDEEAARDREARLALERITASRSYRLIQTLKRVPPWSVYIRMKYGADHLGAGPGRRELGT